MKTLKNRSFLLKIFIVFSFICLSHGDLLMAEKPSEEDSSNQLIAKRILLCGGAATVVASIAYAIYKILGEEKERAAEYMRTLLDRDIARAAQDIIR